MKFVTVKQAEMGIFINGNMHMVTHVYYQVPICNCSKVLNICLEKMLVFGIPVFRILCSLFYLKDIRDFVYVCMRMLFLAF